MCIDNPNGINIIEIRFNIPYQIKELIIKSNQLNPADRVDLNEVTNSF